MTIEELISLVQAHKSVSNLAWGDAVAIEAATGILKKLNDATSTTLRAYDIAITELQKQTPQILNARLLLSGAKYLEIERAGAQSAREALISLALYEAAPYHGESFGNSWATGFNASAYYGESFGSSWATGVSASV